MPDTNFPTHYRMQICLSIAEIGENAWNDLLSLSEASNPFLSYAFLHALEISACVGKNQQGHHTGWQVCFLSLWQGDVLHAAMPLYQKLHSYGEYVFDWSWAEAYQAQGKPYYPKLLSAIPFTPVSGSRLLARDSTAQIELIRALRQLTDEMEFSSAHVLFPAKQELKLLQDQGFQLRQGIQFHWHNPGYRDFDDFLSRLISKKRKNIRAERRKVHDAGIRFQHKQGHEISAADWAFFHRCYLQTYTEHHSHAYLNLSFFLQLAEKVPDNLLLILACLDEKPIAAALYFYDQRTLYGRYWGCLEHYHSLHFETAYYQGQEFCIRQGIPLFEGGAQGSHKLARGFVAELTSSAHYLPDSRFAAAVGRFLEREQELNKSTMQEFLLHSVYGSE